MATRGSPYAADREIDEEIAITQTFVVAFAQL
jgi:hypothetical protein